MENPDSLKSSKGFLTQLERPGSSRESQEMRKSQRNIGNYSKSDYLVTFLNVLKTDLCAMQDVISDDYKHLMAYKLNITSMPANLRKRLTDVENSSDVALIIEKIGKDSIDVEKLKRIYNIQTEAELLRRIANECLLYELFIKKIDQLLLLKILKQADNLKQDSISKFASIKQFLEIYETNTIVDSAGKAKDLDDEQLFSCSSFDDLMMVKPKNEALRHVWDILNKLHKNASDSEKLRQIENEKIEKLTALCEKLEKEKSELIEKLKENEEIKTKLNQNKEDSPSIKPFLEVIEAS